MNALTLVLLIVAFINNSLASTIMKTNETGDKPRLRLTKKVIWGAFMMSSPNGRVPLIVTSGPQSVKQGIVKTPHPHQLLLLFKLWNSLFADPSPLSNTPIASAPTGQQELALPCGHPPWQSPNISTLALPMMLSHPGKNLSKTHQTHPHASSSALGWGSQALFWHAMDSMSLPRIMNQRSCLSWNKMCE